MTNIFKPATQEEVKERPYTLAKNVIKNIRFVHIDSDKNLNKAFEYFTALGNSQMYFPYKAKDILHPYVLNNNQLQSFTPFLIQQLCVKLYNKNLDELVNTMKFAMSPFEFSNTIRTFFTLDGFLIIETRALAYEMFCVVEDSLVHTKLLREINRLNEEQ